MKLRIFLVILFVFVAYVANAFANPFPSKVKVESQSGKSISYGFSYSFEQAGWYGLDPKESYIDALEKYKFKWVRLPFFWNDSKSLDDLEWATAEAEKRNVQVIVALGAKTPYYPEFHLPDNIKSQVKFADTISASHAIASDVLAVDKQVVERLSKFPNISYWQVENEPYLANINNVKIDRSLLSQEINVVRQTDKLNRPIMLTSDSGSYFKQNYIGLLDLMSKGDVLGVSVYFKTQGVNWAAFRIANKDFYVAWPRWLFFPVQSWGFLSPNYEKIKSEAERRGVKVWAVEVQAEPYSRALDDAKRKDLSFGAADLASADSFVKSQGFENVGFWGVSFWQFRKALSDSSWENAGLKIVELVGK